MDNQHTCFCLCQCGGCTALRMAIKTCDCATCQLLKLMPLAQNPPPPAHSCTMDIMDCMCQICNAVRVAAPQCECVACILLTCPKS